MFLITDNVNIIICDILISVGQIYMESTRVCFQTNNQLIIVFYPLQSARSFLNNIFDNIFQSEYCDIFFG